jgi:hypothetical protein
MWKLFELPFPKRHTTQARIRVPCPPPPVNPNPDTPELKHTLNDLSEERGMHANLKLRARQSCGIAQL